MRHRDIWPKSLTQARREASHCRRCPLWQGATQTVFGEGPSKALIMFVGEQPGDKEDLSGRPFVGPAGILLNDVIQASGIDREQAFVTNAVKHFKFEQRGKRRLHKKPNDAEMAACRWWLDLERHFVQPKLIIALGGTAAKVLFRKTIVISKVRGEVLLLPDGGKAMVTIHPSFILRQTEQKARRRLHDEMVQDLIIARKIAEEESRR